MEDKRWLDKVYDHIDNEFRESHLQRIIDLVKQPSICGTGEGIEECSDMVAKILEDIGCVNVHKEFYVHSPIVVGKLEADIENAPSLIMYGMYDVQPPEPLEEWSVPPFAGTIKDYPPYGECVVSRGIANSKGALVCFINAVESIKQTLGYMPVNILFVVEGEEEMGSESIYEYGKAHAEELSKYDATYLNGARQDENGAPCCIFGNKGILYLDIEVTGGNFGGPQKVDVHGMNAAWISNPIWYLVNALASMRDKDDNILIEGFYDDVAPLSEQDEILTKTMIDTFNEEMYLNKRLYAKKFMKNLHGAEAMKAFIWKPTLNIDGIWGGYTGPATKTLVPYKACAKMDVRLVPSMKGEKVLEKIKAHLEKYGFNEVKINVRQNTPWDKVGAECLAAKAALKAMEESGIKGSYAWPIYPGTGPTLGDNLVSYGLGQGGRIHAPDEWMTVRGLQDNEKSCAAYIYYLEKLAREENK